MHHLILQPTATAQWQSLVKEAEEFNHLALSEDLESYLVFLLARFTTKPEMAKSVLAVEYLQSAYEIGRKKQEELREVGDKCLLFAGLFPGRAQRRRVRISYFVEIGQNAYTALAALSQHAIANLYQSLGEEFVPLMDILHVVREISKETASLTPLQAQEVWQDTASQHALTVLRRYTQGILMDADESMDKNKQH